MTSSTCNRSVGRASAPLSTAAGRCRAGDESRPAHQDALPRQRRDRGRLAGLGGWWAGRRDEAGCQPGAARIQRGASGVRGQGPERQDVAARDLVGKATLIDVWATWCGACRAAHPQIQQLYDRLKGRKDIQILSLSVDEAHLAAAYMKEQRYGFPVIASKDVTEKLVPALGVPAYWIVDARGRRSAPYALSHDLDAVIADLERAAKVKR